MKANFLVSFLGLASSFIAVPPDDPSGADRGGHPGLTARTAPPTQGWSDVIKISSSGEPLEGSLFVWLSPGEASTRRARLFDWLTIGPRDRSGRSLDRMMALLGSDLVRPGGRGTDGRLHLTSYGSPGDTHLDKLTAQGMGNRGNRLRETSIALSTDLVRRYQLRGGEEIHLRAGNVSYFLGHYDDTTAKRLRNTVDIYDPGSRLGQNSFLVSIPPGKWELVPRKTAA